VAAELKPQAPVGADLDPRLISQRTPPSRPSSIEEEGVVSLIQRVAVPNSL